MLASYLISLATGALLILSKPERAPIFLAYSLGLT
ncbi:MAG: hypothetical protein RL376_784, partial [Verrucomicrobiota bacterium]